MSKPCKNILFMLHLPPPVHGSSLVGELVKESNIINDSFEGRYINLILSREVHESGKTNVKKLFRFTITWFNLLGNLIHRKPNLCYYALTTTGSGFRKDVLLVALLRLFRVKIVYHLHNKGVLIAKKKKINDLLYRFVFKNSSVIILSKHLYYDIEPYVSKNRVYNCPNGIKDYLPKTSFLNPQLNESFRILFFSNLMREKGVFVLIEACTILNNKGYTFECDFVGGEGDISAKQLTEFIENKGLDKQVKYLGKRFGKLKDMTFEHADVFVLPSRCDCFPLTIIEAMQHCLPVITTTEGGIPDMVEDGKTGFLISPYDDAMALANKIEYFIVNPSQREGMGINGRKKYEHQYTLPIFEQRLHNILSELINN
ncbi:MAG: glycosyltransferase family 4 protein [Fermentimonas sp.]|nr:glycosyltransferase family 4 protein [Fermentimonas sp.]